jgi:Cu+-exporting ATPase
MLADRGVAMRLLSALLVALAVALPACRGCGGDDAAGAGAALDRGSLPDARVTCPVCRLEFDAKEAVATRVYGGVTYYFLLEDHARAFAADPGAFLDAGAASP